MVSIEQEAEYILAKLTLEFCGDDKELAFEAKKLILKLKPKKVIRLSPFYQHYKDIFDSREREYVKEKDLPWIFRSNCFLNWIIPNTIARLGKWLGYFERLDREETDAIIRYSAVPHQPDPAWMYEWGVQTLEERLARSEYEYVDSTEALTSRKVWELAKPIEPPPCIVDTIMPGKEDLRRICSELIPEEPVYKDKEKHSEDCEDYSEVYSASILGKIRKNFA